MTGLESPIFKAGTGGSVRITENPWHLLLMPAPSGSSGIIRTTDGYRLWLPHFGSGSSVIDFRSSKPAEVLSTPESSGGVRSVLCLSIADQVKELLAALSLNKSQLATILRVTRPTVYDWLRGKEPSTANFDRLHALLSILGRAPISGANPLNARFVRQPIALGGPSLLELLGKEPLDEETVLHAIDQVRQLGNIASERRREREDRLRELGFEDPSDEQRRDQLARNIALQDWPKW